MLHLHHPVAALGYAKQILSVDTQFSATYGTAVDDHASTPHTYGTYVEIVPGAAVTTDVWGLEIICHDSDGATADTSSFLKIAVDPAAGGSYTDIISHLAVGNAGLIGDAAQDGSAGYRYFFPVHIKAGSQIGAAVQNNATSSVQWRVILRLYGAPVGAECQSFGSLVTTYGANTATTAGVSITSGEAAEGAWTEIATTTRNHVYFQVGALIKDTVGALNNYYIDLSVGDATNKRVLFQNVLFSYSGNEAATLYMPNPFQCFARTKSGEKLYGRWQCSGTADTGLSMLVYAI